MQYDLGTAMETVSVVKDSIKFVLFMRNILTKLLTYRRLKSLFGPLIGRKKFLYISLPSIYLKCPMGNAIQPYRKRGSMHGGVRPDLPWIRPHDSNAASYIKVLFSDFVGSVEIVLDENIDIEKIHENIVCIGGQSNWVFERFAINNNYLSPLEYRIDKEKGIDGFYNLEMNQSYESNDSDYSYGLFAVIRNPQANNKRIVFVSGLDADATLGIAISLKDNLYTIYKKVRSIKTRHSDFYCIYRFKRTGDPKTPLCYDKVCISKISDKTRI